MRYVFMALLLGYLVLVAFVALHNLWNAKVGDLLGPLLVPLVGFGIFWGWDKIRKQ